MQIAITETQNITHNCTGNTGKNFKTNKPTKAISQITFEVQGISTENVKVAKSKVAKTGVAPGLVEISRKSRDPDVEYAIPINKNPNPVIAE